MKLRLVSDEIVDSPFADAKEKKLRRVVAQGVVDLNEQFVEIQLPESHKPIGAIGSEFDFHVKSVSSLFQGKARLQGSLVSGGK